MPQTTSTINANISNRSLNPGVANTGNINWVSGINGGKNWRMYANTTDILMDNLNKGIMYIKSTDETGAVKLFKAYKYDEIPMDEIPMQDVDLPGMGNFVTKDDLSTFKAEMLDAIKAMNTPAPAQNNNYHKRKPNYNNGGGQNNERS